MNIDRARMEQAILFLAETDQEYARAKALYDGLVELRKTVKANAYMRSAGKTASDRENNAYNSFEYKEHLQKMQSANADYLALQAKRATENTIIDCWRSLNAARNKGAVM